MSDSVPPYKTITAEEARLTLMNMEIGLVGLENEFDYFLLLDQANSFLSSVINYGHTKSILKCKRIELSYLSGGGN